LRSRYNFVPKNKLDRSLYEMVLLNSQLYVTTGRVLASSYNQTRQAWLDLEELRRYSYCVKLVYLQ
jgi:hypothetical protein